jgi:hypothetical protein
MPQKLLCDDGTPFIGPFKCNQCPDHKELMPEVARRRKKRADKALHILEFGKEDDDSTTEEDSDYDSDDYHYPRSTRPYKSYSSKRFKEHLWEVHDITATDMRDATPPGPNGYVGTNYSRILSRGCTVCSYTFQSIREYQTHINTEGAKEVEISLRNGITPTSTAHFTTDQINAHISKLKRQKESKLKGQQLRREAKKVVKPTYHSDQEDTEADIRKYEKALLAGEQITCDICGKIYTRKNKARHEKSLRHVRAVEHPKAPEAPSIYNEFIEEIVNIE